MATSNSTNVNAREALIEFALRRMSMAYHDRRVVAKHLFAPPQPVAAAHFLGDRPVSLTPGFSGVWAETGESQPFQRFCMARKPLKRFRKSAAVWTPR
jgi:hypothetical protein